MGFAKNFTAGFKSLRQGEVSEYTDLLEDARRHAIDRMVANAKLLGANGDRRDALRLLRDGQPADGGRRLRHRRRGRACRRLSRSASRRCSAATSPRTAWTPRSSTAASTSPSRAPARRAGRSAAARAAAAPQAPLGPPPRRVRRGRPGVDADEGALHRPDDAARDARVGRPGRPHPPLRPGALARGHHTVALGDRRCRGDLADDGHDISVAGGTGAGGGGSDDGHAR